MKLGLPHIINAKTSVAGTILVASIASVLTTLTTHFLLAPETPTLFTAPQATLSASGQASVLDCPEGVYSPVQRACVSREVFDAEMQRLFSALGIDTSAYGLGQETPK